MPKYRMLVYRFPYRPEEPELVDWLMGVAAYSDPRIEIDCARKGDTPITMTRNEAVLKAQRGGYDLLLMVDNDMAPDCELGEDRTAKPFLPTAIDFVLGHKGPCVVGAPYCGPPPDEWPYVFRWRNNESHNADPSGHLEMYTREEAAAMTGVQECAALPTGLILCDVRAFAAVPMPWFSYQFKGDGPECERCGVPRPGPQAEKASTEDVVLTRDLSIAGVPQYCAWDSWAGHVKRKVVRKPRPLTADAVSRQLRDVCRSGRPLSTERLMDVKRGNLPRPVPREEKVRTWAETHGLSNGKAEPVEVS